MGAPEATIISAAIAGSVALIALLIQGLYLSRKIADLNLRNEERMEIVKREIRGHEEGRIKRGEQLDLLLNATSIARSAASHIAQSPGISRSEQRLAATAISLTKLATFLEEVSKAETNARLKREDMKFAQDLRTHLMKLFLSLDLDKEGPQYENELKLLYQGFETVFIGFREHVSSIVQFDD
jgi:hypothetical protein